jgi:hypothetical protein
MSADLEQIQVPIPEEELDPDHRFDVLATKVDGLQARIDAIAKAMTTGTVNSGDGSIAADLRRFPNSFTSPSAFQKESPGTCPTGQMIIGIDVWTEQHNKPDLGVLTGLRPICGKFSLQ